MSEMTRRRAETEGRRGSRIDADEGGRYVGIPLNGQCSVQETGCGTPVLAVLPWKFYESIVETLEVLSESELMAKLRESIKDIERGRLLTHEELESRLGL